MNAEVPILRAGETCWQLARAGRVALIVDAAEYFAQVKSAMAKARHPILLICWDFDLRIRLTRGPGSENGTRLGEFLKSIAARRPELQIFILKWDMSVFYTLRW